MRYKSFKDISFTFLQQRISLKGKTPPESEPTPRWKRNPQRKKKKKGNKREEDASPEAPSTAHAHYQLTPLLSHAGNTDPVLNFLFLQTFQTPSQAHLSFCLPTSSPFLRIYSPARSTNILLLSSCKTLPHAWSELKATDGGGPPIATLYTSPVVPTCSHIHNLTKKRCQVSTGSTEGKNATFAPSAKCHYLIFSPLLTTKTKQRCLTVVRYMSCRHSAMLQGDKAPLHLQWRVISWEIILEVGCFGVFVWFFSSMTIYSIFPSLTCSVVLGNLIHFLQTHHPPPLRI